MISASFPKSISLLGNDIILDLSSDQYFATAPAKSVYDLEFTGLPIDGNTLLFKIDSETVEVEIIFKTVPGASMWHFPSMDSGSIESFIETLFIPAWEENIFLSGLYLIEKLNATTVRIEGIEAGFQNNFSLASNASFHSLSLVTSGANGIIYTELNIYLELFYRKHGDSDWQKRVFQALTNKGETRFYLDRMLSSRDVDLNLPAINQSGAEDISSSMLEFKFKYTELYNSSNTNGNKLVESFVFKALPGGVTEDDYSTFDLEAGLDDDKGWLTHFPGTIRVYPEQRFFLNFMHANATITRHLRAKVTFEGGEIGYYFIYENQVLTKDKIYRFALHPSLVKAAVNDDLKVIVAYELFFSETASQDTPIIESLHFELEQLASDDYQEILYRNSFGFFEIQVLTGALESKLELSGSEISLQAAKTYSRSDRRARNYGSLQRRMFTIQSSFKSADEMDHFIDALRSEEIYLVQDTHFQPVTLKQSDIRLYKSSSGRMNTLSVDIYPAKSDKYYSNGRYSI
tara:strand:- start:77640 stop:79190 length:1551 start_codon:yes stop_codon:yes gene_type:complete